jgi:hypothetical protein
VPIPFNPFERRQNMIVEELPRQSMTVQELPRRSMIVQELPRKNMEPNGV